MKRLLFLILLLGGFAEANQFLEQQAQITFYNQSPYEVQVNYIPVFKVIQGKIVNGQVIVPGEVVAGQPIIVGGAGKPITAGGGVVAGQPTIAGGVGQPIIAGGRVVAGQFVPDLIFPGKNEGFKLPPGDSQVIRKPIIDVTVTGLEGEIKGFKKSTSLIGCVFCQVIISFSQNEFKIVPSQVTKIYRNY